MEQLEMLQSLGIKCVKKDDERFIDDYDYEVHPEPEYIHEDSFYDDFLKELHYVAYGVLKKAPESETELIKEAEKYDDIIRTIAPVREVKFKTYQDYNDAISIIAEKINFFKDKLSNVNFV